MTTIARRIQWLLPVDREVYDTARVPAGMCPSPECERCGGVVHAGDVLFSVRDRGSSYRNRTIAYLHRRCVPTREFQTAGVPARKVRRGA